MHAAATILGKQVVDLGIAANRMRITARSVKVNRSLGAMDSFPIPQEYQQWSLDARLRKVVLISVVVVDLYPMTFPDVPQ